MKLATKTLGIKFARKPNDLEIRGYLVRVRVELTEGEENGKLEVVINEENHPFILNRITNEIYLTSGIPAKFAIAIEEELKKLGYGEEFKKKSVEDKIEI